MAGETVHRYGFEVWNAAGTAVVMSANTAGLLTVDKVTSGAGTVSLPAIYLNADTNTGWYHIGADNWGFAANGTKVLDISATAMSSVLNPTFTRGSSVTQTFNPAAAQDIQSAQKRTGLHCDGVTGTAASAPTTNFSIGTSDATIFCTFVTKTSAPITTDHVLCGLSGGLTLYQKMGTLQLQYQEGTGTLVDTGLFIEVNRIHTVFFKRYSGKVRIYLDGVASAEFTDEATDVNAAKVFALSNSGTYTWEGSFYRAGLLNYALPEDKIRRYSAGERLDWEDLNGSMTSIVTGNDSTFSGAGNWVTDGDKAPTFTPNSPAGKATFTCASGTGNGYIRLGGLTIGKKYRITLKARLASGTSRPLYIGQLNNQPSFGTITPTGTEATYSAEFTANESAGNLGIGYIGADYTGTVYEIDDVLVIPLGALAAYEGENLLPSATLWPDSSGNNNDLTITGATTINLQDSLELTDKLIVGGTTTLGKSTASSPHLVYKGVRIDSNSGSDSRIEFTYAGAATKYTQYFYNPDTSLRWATGAGVDFLVLASTGDFWAIGNVSALSFTDRTPFPESSVEALAAINSLKRLPPETYKKNNKAQQMDHSKVHAFLKGGTADSRDLSATVSCLVVVVQDLLKEIDNLKKSK
jgi:hypothetical protein